MTIVTSIFDYHPKEKLKDVGEICKLGYDTFVFFEREFQDRLELIQKNKKNVKLVEVDPNLYLTIFNIFTKECNCQDIEKLLIAHWTTMLFKQESIITKYAYHINNTSDLVSSDPRDCIAGDQDFWISFIQKEIVKLKDT